jgi:hypothetical protein
MIETFDHELISLSGSTTLSYTEWHINRDNMARDQRNLEVHNIKKDD